MNNNSKSLYVSMNKYLLMLIKQWMLVALQIHEGKRHKFKTIRSITVINIAICSLVLLVSALSSFLALAFALSTNNMMILLAFILANPSSWVYAMLIFVKYVKYSKTPVPRIQDLSTFDKSNYIIFIISLKKPCAFVYNQFRLCGVCTYNTLQNTNLNNALVLSISDVPDFNTNDINSNYKTTTTAWYLIKLVYSMLFSIQKNQPKTYKQRLKFMIGIIGYILIAMPLIISPSSWLQGYAFAILVCNTFNVSMLLILVLMKHVKFNNCKYKDLNDLPVDLEYVGYTNSHLFAFSEEPKGIKLIGAYNISSSFDFDEFKQAHNIKHVSTQGFIIPASIITSNELI